MNKPHPLGKLCPTDAYRDAIHVAIIPVVADCHLAPGQFIGIIPVGDGTYTTCSYEQDAGPDGVVDPFLKAWVSRGEVFWAIIRPDLVGEVRHEWSFAAPKQPDESEFEELTKVVLEAVREEEGMLPPPLYETAAERANCYRTC